MKKSVILAVLALASLSFASTQSLKTEANKMNSEVAHAFMHKDMDAFEKITRAHVTSDFKHVEMGKTQTYDEMLAEMKQSFGSIKKLTSCTAVTSHVMVHGDTGTSITNHRMVGVIVGPDNKDHKMVMTGATKDTYRKEGGMWKLSEMNWTSQKMTLDGKPYNPSMGH
ncbi:MAG TPA: nuclear transport factor 2 family protein [Fimbriimonadaceae bacterium]|jgi:hypothetical protein